MVSCAACFHALLTNLLFWRIRSDPPQAFSAARHRARLTVLVINVRVVTVNYQVFAALKTYLLPIVPIAFSRHLPYSFLASYLHRHLPDRAVPHVLYADSHFLGANVLHVSAALV